MLMHSCYCVFISVTGGFVQRLKDFKNLLKMSLKILFIKRKRKFPSIPSLPQFRPAGLSFRQPNLAYRWRTVPAQPRQPSNPTSRSAQPSSRSLAAPAPAPGNRPRPAADARAPPVGAAPNLPRPAPAPGQGGTAVQRPGVVGAPPSCPSASLKGSRAPLVRPCCPAPISPRSRTGGPSNRRSEVAGFRRPPPRGQPSPSRLRLRFSPVVSSPWSPLSPHAFHFAFRGL